MKPQSLKKVPIYTIYTNFKIYVKFIISNLKGFNY